MNYNKYCVVPLCKSTTVKTPNKLFIRVPVKEQIRRKWLQLAQRQDALTLSTDSRMYFCEDHFDVVEGIKMLSVTSPSYKCCIVPQCKSTKIRTPNKLFICIPKERRIRDKWLIHLRPDYKKLSPFSTLYICEDHFDLPNDMENYMEYKLMGKINQVRMHPHCVPTKFITHRTVLKEEENQDTPEIKIEITEEFDIKPDPDPVPYPTPAPILPLSKQQEIDKLIADCEEVLNWGKKLPDEEVLISEESSDETTEPPEVVLIEEPRVVTPTPLTFDKCVQANFCHKFRSKATQTKPMTRDRATSPTVFRKIKGKKKGKRKYKKRCSKPPVRATSSISFVKNVVKQQPKRRYQETRGPPDPLSVEMFEPLPKQRRPHLPNILRKGKLTDVDRDDNEPSTCEIDVNASYELI